MKKINKNLIFGLIILYTIYYILFTAPTAQAQVIGNLDFLKGIVPCGTSYAPSPCTVCHFYKLLQNVINFLLLISSSLVTLMAVYIGFLFLFSGGSPQKITDAKSKLWLLVWGLVWVLGSWLVLNTIITVFANPAVFPTPWNRISCEISQSSGGGNLGGGNLGGNGNVPSPGPLGATNDVIAANTTIVFTQQGNTFETIIANSASGQTLTNSSQQDGAGIALVRASYPNVFIMGERDLSLQDAAKLKKALDETAAMLPASYDVKNKIIFIPTDDALTQSLWETAGGEGGVTTQANALISRNNVVVFNGVAYAQAEDISLTAWEQQFGPGEKFAAAGNNTTFVMVHELAHIMANKVIGNFYGDAEWVDLHYGIETKKTGFITEYAKSNAAEDLAETITIATLALNGKAKAYTGNLTADKVLQKKYEYLKKNGLIKDVPPRVD